MAEAPYEVDFLDIPPAYHRVVTQVVNHVRQAHDAISLVQVCRCTAKPRSHYSTLNHHFRAVIRNKIFIVTNSNSRQ